MSDEHVDEHMAYGVMADGEEFMRWKITEIGTNTS